MDLPGLRGSSSRRRLLALACAAALAAEAAWSAETIPLKLVRALPVEGLDNAHPSGLTIVDGQLYAVSDQHDHAVCRIRLHPDRAVLEPHVTFNAPWSGAWVLSLDFEGIAYKDGFFFLVSEAILRVLRVHETGTDLAWVTPGVEKEGLEAGLFGDRKARLEGLALLGGGRLLLAAERAPRGLVEVVIAPGGGEAAVSAHAFGESLLELPEPLEPDFSDLFYDGKDLYALSRNAEAVLRIEYEAGELRELAFWSFGEVTGAPEYRYLNQRSGRAEGLCMDAEHVYVVLDNNDRGRQTDPGDTRPLLFLFRRPPAAAAAD